MNVLIGIPAYNEERSVAHVIERTHAILPDYDIVVVNDGSRDTTAAVVASSVATLISLPFNLGYGTAVETIMRYAMMKDYEAVVLIDADGQHKPEYLAEMLQAFRESGCDMLIGSRYVESRRYRNTPLERRIGMVIFSVLTGLLVGQRIYDTSSGMKVISRRAIEALLNWHFIDFHAEAIVYLSWLGYTIGEYPVTVEERRYGTSMHSMLSLLRYPLSVILMIIVSWIQSSIYKKEHRKL
jgi:glycosyltransferase involved in cell wall biosynthesis